MKTTDMETVYDLGTKMIDAIQKEKIQAAWGGGDRITTARRLGIPLYYMGIPQIYSNFHIFHGIPM